MRTKSHFGHRSSCEHSLFRRSGERLKPQSYRFARLWRTVKSICMSFKQYDRSFCCERQKIHILFGPNRRHLLAALFGFSRHVDSTSRFGCLFCVSPSHGRTRTHPHTHTYIHADCHSLCRACSHLWLMCWTLPRFMISDIDEKLRSHLSATRRRVRDACAGVGVWNASGAVRYLDEDDKKKNNFKNTYKIPSRRVVFARNPDHVALAPRAFIVMFCIGFYLWDIRFDRTLVLHRKCFGRHSRPTRLIPFSVKAFFKLILDFVFCFSVAFGPGAQSARIERTDAARMKKRTRKKKRFMDDQRFEPREHWQRQIPVVDRVRILRK